jgi:hypothetical protein
VITVDRDCESGNERLEEFGEGNDGELGDEANAATAEKKKQRKFKVNHSLQFPDVQSLQP